MNVTPIETRIFKEREDLVAFITKHVPKLKNGSVLAVTSKIVALSEGRTFTAKNKKEKERIIKSESTWAIESYPQWWLTVKDGTFVVNAGVDDSNADGKIVLLPKDSFRAAEKIRAALRKKYRIKKFG